MQYLSQRLADESARKRVGEPSRDAVEATQRERLLSAAEQLIAERGCSGTSIEAIVKLAKVSSVTFYEHFEDKEESFVAAFERAVEETRVKLREVVSEELPWNEQIRAGLRTLVAMIAAKPARARMCLVEAQMGGPKLEARYEAALDSAAPKLREGRALGFARGLPETSEEATIGGIAWLLRQRLELDGGLHVDELLPQMVEMALSPYMESDAVAQSRVEAVAGSG